MVKKIIEKPGRTFSEYSLLTDYTPSDYMIENISLDTKLHDNLILKIPFLSAAMMCVTGYEMALALGKEGGLGVLPVRMPIEEQVDIVRKIKDYKMNFVGEPVKVNEDVTIEKVIREIERFGHSTIPVVDKNNTFLGIFTEEHYRNTSANINDKVKSAMIEFKSGEILYHNNPNISLEDAKKMLESNNKNYLVVLDKLNRLEKLAFKRDIEGMKVGTAISTHAGWEERVEANVEAGVDLIVIDTSDAYNEFTQNVIKKYKKDMKIETPLCAGNVITYDGANFLIECGADIIKVGMSSGSICSTQREKAVGRAPMSALIDVDKVRDNYFKKYNKYIPIVVDGGIVSAADMIIALTIADVIMMGFYFNRFYEAAGKKIGISKDETRDETKIVKVETWGEGSIKAQNLDRYDHFSQKTFFPEGEEGTVPYAGRLKPNLNKDIKKIKAALSNVGCKNLKEFRKKSVIELLSLESSFIISDIHHITKKD